jgi:Tol biopolymer transport system component
MGEVYRAFDTRLNRDVALKTLPDGTSADRDRTTRFRREAHVLASLNHPNVAAIYGLEESPAGRALVMEMVEGPTLSGRLGVGALSLDEVIPLARQIAEAIEYAHEHGVIHRDLKPSNIKITPAGLVKVLDFGLAKALEPGSGRSDEEASRADHSPTVSLAATASGIILGTAAYMSPEQAKGKPLDRRTDIWSFGVVLFEMLTGRRTFSGETVSETIAHVITQEPDWTLLPPTTPPRLRELLRRCLIKDPRNRLQAIGEARIALSQVAELDSAGGESVDTAVPSFSRRREGVVFAVAVVSVIAAGALFVRERLTPAPEIRRVQFDMPTPDFGGFGGGFPQGMVSLSPDGRHVAFVAIVDGKRMLWVHSFESGRARPLEDTEGIGPATLIWSPDGRWLAFTAGGRLRRVPATGGRSHVICALPDGARAAWGADDVILLGNFGGALHRVAASGGEAVPETALNAIAGEASHRFPSFLPDGRHYFYLASDATNRNSVTYVGLLGSAERRRLEGVTSEVRYTNGHVLFVRDGSLMTQRFNVDTRALEGDAIPVVDQFTVAGEVAGAYSVSTTGTLAYRILSVRAPSRLVWYDRAGTPGEVVGSPDLYSDLDLSTDDRRVAFEATRGEMSGSRSGDIWMLDLETRVTSRVTSHADREADPAVSPDGASVVFRSDRDGGHLYLRTVGVVGEDILFFRGETRESPDHWSPDGRHVIFTSAAGELWAVPVTGARQAVRLTHTPFLESEGRVSPNGRWLAYESNETGREEIYVQAFPTAARRQQVSMGGGTIPRWSAKGQELFYVGPDQTLTSVSVRQIGDGLKLTAPVRLFRLPVQSLEGEYAVSSTGRFLVNVPTAERKTPPMTVVLNWAATLGK